MKHFLSHAIVLAYSTGLSVCAASTIANKPFSESDVVLTPEGRPHIALIRPFPNEKEIAERDGHSLQPIQMNKIPDSLRKSVSSSLSGSSESILENESGAQQQLNKIRKIKSEYEVEKKSLENQAAEIATNLASHQRVLEARSTYICDKNMTDNPSDTSQGSVAFHLSTLKNTLGSLSNQQTEEKDQLARKIALLEKDPSEIQSHITAGKKNLGLLDEQIKNIKTAAIYNSVKEYETMVSLKLTTPFDLSQFGGQIFDHGVLVTRGEVRLALIEMGLPKALLNNDVVDVVMGAALPKLVWPVFSLPSNSTDISLDRESFLFDLKDRTTNILAKVQTNYDRNVNALSALIRLMKKEEISLAFDDVLTPDDFFLHLTKNKVIPQKPDDKTSMFLKNFYEEELFQNVPKLRSKSRMQSIETLSKKLPPTNMTALLLLTQSIVTTPTVLEKIGSRDVPAQIGLNTLLNKDESDEDAPLAQSGEQAELQEDDINGYVLGSLAELNFDRFNMLLLNNIRQRLTHITPATKTQSH